MEKVIKIGIVVFVLVFILFAMLSIRALDEGKKEFNKAGSTFQEKLGQKFVLDNDTLTIVDYSLLMGTFTLSDGKQISSELVFKQDNKKTSGK